MNQTYFITQIEEVIKEYEAIDFQGRSVEQKVKTVITKAKAAVARITGLSSEYYKDTISTLESTRIHSSSIGSQVIGILRALKSDLEKGYLKSLNQLIQADIFSDYLEMAEHLLENGFKDPAAVLIGSTLENHIRELSRRNNLDIVTIKSNGDIIAKSADTMNQGLAKAGIYSSGYQKQITAWFGLRNAAAHGKYSEYSESQIKLMLEGVRQFILHIN